MKCFFFTANSVILEPNCVILEANSFQSNCIGQHFSHMEDPDNNKHCHIGGKLSHMISQ